MTSGSNQDVSAPATGALADISGTPGTVADATDAGIAAAEVPEPSSIALMMAGMA
ncbi:MAG: PEP-CTERM sorting domain-containing protein, partial [Oxalobacteraceae bacterium]